MLGNAAGFAGCHIRRADSVEQRGFAMVDMAHDGHDGRAMRHLRRIVRNVEQAFLDVGFCHAANAMAHFLGDKLRRVGIDHIVDRSIWPCFISRRITSTARSDMRLARSEMVIASGIVTSRTSFSFGSSEARPLSRWVRRRNEATERSRTSPALSAVMTVRRPRCFRRQREAPRAERRPDGRAAAGCAVLRLRRLRA